MRTAAEKSAMYKLLELGKRTPGDNNNIEQPFSCCTQRDVHGAKPGGRNLANEDPTAWTPAELEKATVRVSRVNGKPHLLCMLPTLPKGRYKQSQRSQMLRSKRRVSKIGKCVPNCFAPSPKTHKLCRSLPQPEAPPSHRCR